MRLQSGSVLNFLNTWRWLTRSWILYCRIALQMVVAMATTICKTILPSTSQSWTCRDVVNVKSFPRRPATVQSLSLETSSDRQWFLRLRWEVKTTSHIVKLSQHPVGLSMTAVWTQWMHCTQQTWMLPMTGQDLSHVTSTHTVITVRPDVPSEVTVLILLCLVYVPCPLLRYSSVPHGGLALSECVIILFSLRTKSRKPSPCPRHIPYKYIIYFTHTNRIMHLSIINAVSISNIRGFFFVFNTEKFMW
jgi:hypothetical protein